MDDTTLEDAIEREAEERIAAIRDREIREMQRLDEINRTGTENFRKQTQAGTDAQIRQELTKLENKMVLECQKLDLSSVENFTGRILEDVMSGIRKHPRYPQFLLSSVLNAVQNIPGRAEVKLAREDLFRESEIQEAVRAAGSKTPLIIGEDSSIHWGGCLVVDEEGGRIFNQTLERIYFRKSLLIRRSVMKILADISRKADETH